MDFLFDGIANALAYLYDLTGSFGLAIMLLTLGVMVLVTPLTLKSTRSMIAMQQLQPELRKLQAKYKDDRQKLNEEMMAFYKEHNINPLGGCLPLIVQAPVFIVLYRVLIGLTKLPSYGEDMGRAVGMFARNPAGGGIYAGYGTFEPGYLDHTAQLFLDLNVSRAMQFMGLDLADSFMNVLRVDGVVAALPYLALVLVIGLTAWYQQRQIQGRMGDKGPQINPQQQMLMKVMPFFLPIFSLTLPAGVVLYFLVSNLYRIGQQAFITRTMYSEKAKAEREKAFAEKKRKAGVSDDDEELADKVSRKDTVPTASRSFLGGLIQLPARAEESEGGPNGKEPSKSAKSDTAGKAANRSGSAAKSGTASKAKTTPGGRTPARSAPSRAAPSRPARPANQNRSKKKKQRK